MVKEITYEGVKEQIESIKRGYLPDWNYATGALLADSRVVGHESMPDEYYPLHVALSVAIEALEKLKDDDEFFERMDAKF